MAPRDIAQQSGAKDDLFWFITNPRDYTSFRNWFRLTSKG
ncbi:Hypothetical protein RAK1035_2870 [Roseovarius sp. AK1035]|nr:Hypothetical protein RAK1035_2870 [Roseovarius sp. AK1035]